MNDNLKKKLLELFEGEPLEVFHNGSSDKCLFCGAIYEFGKIEHEDICSWKNAKDEFFKEISNDKISSCTPDVCPECQEEYSGLCGGCAIGHARG